MRTVIRSTIGLIILAILIGMNGCMFYPVSKKDVIGTYQAVLEDGTPGLPDGGSEILALRENGTCIQQVALKDGRTFSAQGTWELGADSNWYFKTVILMGVYDVVDPHEAKLRTNIEWTIKNVVSSLSVYRNLIGWVALGSEEGPHYEKK